MSTANPIMSGWLPAGTCWLLAKAGQILNGRFNNDNNMKNGRFYFETGSRFSLSLSNLMLPCMRVPRALTRIRSLLF